MKIGRIFWGSFFVTVGVLFLLENVDVLTVDWADAWRWWPILLVLAGIAMLFRLTLVKAAAAVVAGIALGLLVVSILNFSWCRGSVFTGPVAREEVLTEPFDSSVTRARFTLESGAGAFTVRDTTTALVTAETRSSLGSYSLHRTHEADRERVKLSLEGGRGRGFLGRIRNSADVRLNPSPTWDLVMNVGASKVDLDLEPFTVEDLNIDCGAASITVRLGDRASESHVSVDAGVSSIRFKVPESVGCEVRFDGALTSRRLSGFQRVGKNFYHTENMEGATKKVYMSFHTGVSTIRVERY